MSSLPVIARSASGDTVTYGLEVSASSELSFHIVAVFPVDAAESLELSLPVSRPGSVTRWTFSRLVSRVEARQGGAPLRVRRIDPRTWSVTPRSRGAVEVTYHVDVDHSNELRLGSSWIDEDSAYVDGASVFLYSPHHRRVPVRVRVARPEGWKLVTALARDADGYLVAEDYDGLVDRPIQLGRSVSERVVVARCAAVRLVFDKTVPTYDAAALDDNVRRILDVEADLFGGCPFREYIVFFHWRPDLENGGGLEHGRSAVINIGRSWMDDLPAAVAGTFAHELFHAWNGKALQPACTHTWEYRDENPCPLLWFVEGVSTYYAAVALTRAGISTTSRFLGFVGDQISCLENSPARGWMTLNEAAIAAWARPARTVDYYCGGAVVGLLLDLAIRQASANTRSLDEVMRTLYRESGRPSYRGYTERDLARIASTQAGTDVRPLLRTWIASSNGVDYLSRVAPAGLNVVVDTDADGRKRFSLRRTSGSGSGADRMLDTLLAPAASREVR